MGRLLSVNVGLPRDVTWQDKTVHTGIWKTPVEGPQMVRRLNIDGDGQGDLTGHGGERRAVLVYQHDSYRYWQNQLGRAMTSSMEQFGENFTVDGLPDAEVCIGDRYRIGGALIRGDATACHLLPAGHPHERAGDGRTAGQARKTWLLFPCAGGRESTGGRRNHTHVASGPERMSVSEIDALLYKPGHPRDQLERALRIPMLSVGLASILRGVAADKRATAARRRETPGSMQGVWAAAGVAGIPPTSRIAQGTRERQRDFAAARARGRTARRDGPRLGSLSCCGSGRHLRLR